MVFVGPSAEAIRAMGLKDAAKALMEEAGVPVVPGYHGSDQSDQVLAEAAAKIGYPVLIKAVAGGGGKGMRVVEAPEDFARALEAARNEARAAFDNGDVLVEKLIGTPRHIEIQIFGDGTRAVHLFERDCSLQRRHQKVIEEAPAPGMTPAMREAMGAAAVRAAEAIGYTGAGTVEFIADGAGGLDPEHFYFMEMNTRLQVEHPVTEAITGVDLVEWQLRVAAGEGLPLAQEDLAIQGHAFEARLYAEDAAAGFLPATGTLEHLVFPGAPVRVEAGVRQGDAITPHYDPMIAKLIVHGADRDTALAALQMALAATEVAGTVTNLGFLAALARDAGFAEGEVDTGLIARRGVALTEPLAPPAEAWAAAALVLAGLDEGPRASGPFAGFTLWAPMEQPVLLGERMLRLKVSPSGVAVCVEGEWIACTPQTTGWQIGRLRLTRLGVLSSLGVSVFLPDGTHTFAVTDPLDQQGAEEGGDLVRAPMPGLVRALHVAPGDTVTAGVPLAVLEAMKMEHSLTAPRDGIVAEVLCQAGAQVASADVLISLVPEGESA